MDKTFIHVLFGVWIHWTKPRKHALFVKIKHTKGMHTFTDKCVYLPVPQWPRLLCWMPWWLPRTVSSNPLWDGSEVRNDMVWLFCHSTACWRYLLGRLWRARQWHVCSWQEKTGLGGHFAKRFHVRWFHMLVILCITYFLLSSAGSFMSFCILETKNA